MVYRDLLILLDNTVHPMADENRNIVDKYILHSGCFVYISNVGFQLLFDDTVELV